MSSIQANTSDNAVPACPLSVGFLLSPREQRGDLLTRQGQVERAAADPPDGRDRYHLFALGRPNT
jgi:hypothetical protein